MTADDDPMSKMVAKALRDEAGEAGAGAGYGPQECSAVDPTAPACDRA